MHHQDILVSARGLSAMADEPNLRILDCRFNLLAPEAGRADYESGHIPGAVYVDLNVDLAGPVSPLSGRHPLPDAETAAATFGRLGVGNDSRVVVYDDQGGAIAARAWWMLRWLGHQDVRLLDGGINAWTEENLPLQQGAVVRPAQSFTALPQTGWTIDAEEILHGNASSLQLVDARAAQRFAGEAEPIDAVAGHIPGAVNLPFDRGLTPDGRWRPVDELRQLWRETLADGLEAPCSVMCGSGVTACHLVVAAQLAGIRVPRLYVGSWSEWIRDGTRPVATGWP